MAQQYRAQDSNLDLTGQSRPSCRWTSPVAVSLLAISWRRQWQSQPPSARDGGRDRPARQAWRGAGWGCRSRPAGDRRRWVNGWVVGRPGVAPGRVRRRRLYRPPRLSSGLPPQGGLRSVRGSVGPGTRSDGPKTPENGEGPPGFPLVALAPQRRENSSYVGRTPGVVSLLIRQLPSKPTPALGPCHRTAAARATCPAGANLCPTHDEVRTEAR